MIWSRPFTEAKLPVRCERTICRFHWRRTCGNEFEPITGIEKSGPEKRCVGGTLLIAAADDSSKALTTFLQKISKDNGAFLTDTKIFQD
ncbi:hypothetical protein CEXT_662591 [Caerostris extrusa]|uniref:Uncharacterized protein n=1 Tax=Caerostris extrusa TaxID=172846 RepID=A0AAV4VE74_CAEEX|nr:hypothetical protein CEXT_662591 [Caerostris extrusa]